VDHVKKELSYSVSRTIETLPVQGDIVAFRDERKVGDTVIFAAQGLATLAAIESTSGYDEIVPLARYSLCHSSVPEMFHQNTWSHVIDDIYAQSLIYDHPYTHIKEHGADKTVILRINAPMDGHNYDLAGEKIPCGYHFDYMNGHVDNAHYDLEKIEEILLARDDIRFYKEGSQQIPYYNAENGRTRHLHFLWIPSDEDFAKLRHIRDRFDVYRTIKSDILGFPPEKKVDY
jgi:hypothetical protein